MGKVQVTIPNQPELRELLNVAEGPEHEDSERIELSSATVYRGR
jgi:hypothetical protein